MYRYRKIVRVQLRCSTKLQKLRKFLLLRAAIKVSDGSLVVTTPSHRGFEKWIFRSDSTLEDILIEEKVLLVKRKATFPMIEFAATS